jgi:co-chaperonin GroES (HSP10)
LVKRLQGEEKTASGIIIPDNAKETAKAKPLTSKLA